MPYFQLKAHPSHLLHYARAVRIAHRRGMGQDSSVTDTTIPPIETAPPTDLSYYNPSPSDYLPGGGVITPSVPTAGGTPFNLSALINSLTQGAVAGTNIYQRLQGPSLVPGTQAIFNPTTGQFFNPTTGQVVNPIGAQPTTNIPLAGLTSSPLLLIGGLAIGGILLVSLMSRKN